MNNEYKPVLICNGDEKHLREDGELTCGGCGYIFDSKSTEYFFNSIEIKPDCISGETKVYSAPLCCERCGREFEKCISARSVKQCLSTRLSPRHPFLKNVI